MASVILSLLIYLLSILMSRYNRQLLSVTCADTSSTHCVTHLVLGGALHGAWPDGGAAPQISASPPVQCHWILKQMTGVDEGLPSDVQLERALPRWLAVWRRSPRLIKVILKKNKHKHLLVTLFHICYDFQNFTEHKQFTCLSYMCTRSIHVV